MRPSNVRFGSGTLHDPGSGQGGWSYAIGFKGTVDPNVQTSGYRFHTGQRPETVQRPAAPAMQRAEDGSWGSSLKALARGTVRPRPRFCAMPLKKNEVG